MKDILFSRILASATPMMIVCAILAFGVSAVAQSDHEGPGSRRCSNQTLFGDYGMLIEGTILGPNFPLRTVSMAHYDGTGNLTLLDHVVVNGVPPEQEWRPGSGTYTVNPDCTGKAVINTGPGNPPLSFYFVVVKHGTEIRGVVDGSAITINGSRVD